MKGQGSISHHEITNIIEMLTYILDESQDIYSNQKQTSSRNPRKLEKTQTVC